MTGAEIKCLREKLGMDVREWAQLLGCAESTAYRWEQGPLGFDGADSADVFWPAVGVNPLQRKLLAVLKKLSEDVSPQTLGRELLQAVQMHGGLYGLWLLLEFFYRDR